LAGKDDTFEDPVKRTAFQQFSLALGPHARDVAWQPIGAFGTRGLLPINQVLDAFSADAELY
jgi:hypothetical protein